jgi:hypothetical protein
MVREIQVLLETQRKGSQPRSGATAKTSQKEWYLSIKKIRVGEAKLEGKGMEMKSKKEATFQTRKYHLYPCR